MSQPCPRCHGSRFERARLESAVPVTLLMADGHRRPLSALVCQDCGFVAFLAQRVGQGATGASPPPEVQEYDF